MLALLFRWDDILVGAPLFMEHLSTQKLREVGQVYVYLQKESYHVSHIPDQILTGTHTYGRFGSTIAPLGDIDHDGFNGENLLLHVRSSALKSSRAGLKG